MMNKVILVGRTTKDIELSYSTGEKAQAVGRFNIAVQRKYKNSEGNYEADFPSCVAFGNNAEFISKYFKKGDMIGIVGHLQTGSYVGKDGTKRYSENVIVDEVDFVSSKSSSNNNDVTTANANKASDDDFMNIPDGAPEEEELPW